MKATLSLLEEFFGDCDQSGWGYSDQQIAATEERLSVSFPKVLKQYYTRFGICPYIKQYGNNIPVPLTLEDFYLPDSAYNAPYTPKELDFLVFSSFSDVSAIDYGIRLSDLSLEDPPVYFCDYGNTSWIPAYPSLLNFLITSAFWQIAYESRLNYDLNISQFDYDSQELPNLNHYLTALDMRDHELEQLVYEDGYCYYRIFINDGVILGCETTSEWTPSAQPPCEHFEWLTAASIHKEKILAIQKIPGLLWEEDKI